MLLDADRNLSPARFLREYWQKKTLLLRQALPGFEPELDEEDIAGLACEPLADSRLVTGVADGTGWRVRHGPFEESDFRALPERGWTLLVQDVEKHYPPLQRLLQEFAFLPAWRIDDLMVSVAGPGGSVGPHADQYDVFLLQAKGSRRWQLSECFEPDLRSDCELQVLKDFVPEREWVLQPGDLLYLPPGVAHHGVALNRCMTWSIGMRAPSGAELFQSLGEWLAQRGDCGGRYRDPDLHPRSDSGEIDAEARRRFRQLARGLIEDDADFCAFLGSFLSRYGLAQEPAAPDHVPDSTELRAALRAGNALRADPWTRLLWVRIGDRAWLFAGGARFACDPETAATICDPVRLGALDPDFSDEVADLACRLLGLGHLYLETL